MHEYTDYHSPLLKEYGRNVQKLVSYVLTIKDKDERTQKAHLIVELMKQIHPNYKEVQDIPSKFWDDLFLISGFQLDVDAPFPMPEKNAIGKKPQKVAYSNNHIRFKHYGRNIQTLIEQVASRAPDEDTKEVEIALFRLVRGFYLAWQKETLEDSVIIGHLKELTKGKINLRLEDVSGESIVAVSNDTRNKDRNFVGSNNNNNNNNFKNKNKKNNQFKKKNRPKNKNGNSLNGNS